MAKRVLLHVGTMKSATTYVQSLCQANASRLLEGGVLWPGTAVNFAATQDLLGTQRRRSSHGRAWETLVKQVREFDQDVLISNEMLLNRSRADLSRLVEALAPAEVRIIITARDLGRVIPSHWQTMVRSGQTTTGWTPFVESVLRGPDARDEVSATFWRQHDLPRAVARCASVASLDHVVLVTVPLAGSDPTMTGSRFLSALDVIPADFAQPVHRKVSFGIHSAELARRLNEDVRDWDWADRRAAVRRALYAKVLENRANQEPRLVMTPEQWESASDWARELVAGLQAIDVRVIGDVDELLPGVHSGTAALDPADSTAEDLLAAAQYGLVGLAHQYARLAAHDEKLSNRLKGLSGPPARYASEERAPNRARRRVTVRRLLRSMPGARRAANWRRNDS